ncbi:TfuA-like protein [Paraburkholderia caledonica]|uniref:TfuA-like core domain-containing protein n=1 Tax=Paraburkholderia caledonica TaxID=134536 RepID=A0AB73IQ05_9BURK|nr:hypothetical protein [Paraburkholderia caledonica]
MDVLNTLLERSVVFGGPSIRSDDAARIACELRPPARRNDVLAASKEGKQLIVIVDGHMAYLAPPSPMEILQCIQNFGTRIVGASSLGALRAVELRHHGMTGTGWVYEQFLKGHVDADDELLVLMHPETFQPITVPLINVRYGLARLLVRQVVTPDQCQRILETLGGRSFEQRTKGLIVDVLADLGLHIDLANFLTSEESDIKGKDARECLQSNRLLRSINA